MDNLTIAWPLNTYYAAYVNPAKSVPFQTPAGTVENTLGLGFWNPEQRYIVSVEDYLRLIDGIEYDEHVVNDPNTGNLLLKYRVASGKSGVWDGQEGNGMILLQYSSELMAYRKRPDGLLGVESISGLLDTRLSSVEYNKNPEIYPNNVPTTSTAEADFTNFEENMIKRLKAEKQKEKQANRVDKEGAKRHG